jgi:hypothetical protein
MESMEISDTEFDGTKWNAVGQIPQEEDNVSQLLEPLSRTGNEDESIIQRLRNGGPTR